MSTAGADLEIFKNITSGDRLILEKAFQKKTAAAGEIICSHGDAGGTMFIVISGSVEILRPKRKEGEFETAAVLDAGQVIGEASLIGQQPRSATVRAKGPVEMIVVDRVSLGQLKRDNPALVISLYEGMLLQLARRFRNVSDKQSISSFWLG
jgi:CRP-like cAMP-binding protein